MSFLDRVVRRVRKFSAMTTFHMDCGSHGGVPPCCVLWATFVYFPIERLDQLFELYPRPKWHFRLAKFWAIITDPGNTVLKRDLGRVACPWCAVFGKPITVQRCYGHTECKDFLSSKRQKR